MDAYYVYEDGTIRFPYLDPADGLCKSAIPEVAACSTALSCAEIAVKVAPIFISDEFDALALQALASENITFYYDTANDW